MTLVTGASGFLGKGFLESLSPQEAQRYVCVSRSATQELARACGHVVQGDFWDASILRELDNYPISRIVHLAAVTGGCSEDDASVVNVEGPRKLMRHFMDRGCKRFVLASSIAAIGLQRIDFRPVSLPITEEHPCLDRDGYGFSKFLMEEIAKYHARQDSSLTIACLRFGVIQPDDLKAERYNPAALHPWVHASFSVIARKDAVRAIHLSLEKSDWAGVHVMNIVNRHANLSVPVESVMKTWHPGWEPDLSYYQKAGHEYDSIFCTKRACKELDFVADLPEGAARS